MNTKYHLLIERECPLCFVGRVSDCSECKGTGTITRTIENWSGVEALESVKREKRLHGQVVDSMREVRQALEEIGIE